MYLKVFALDKIRRDIINRRRVNNTKIIKIDINSPFRNIIRKSKNFSVNTPIGFKIEGVNMEMNPLMKPAQKLCCFITFMA